MGNVNWQDVSFTTRDDLILHGLQGFDKPSGWAVVYVHGKCGNNYENAFIQDIAAAAVAADINFLAFNNRGSGCIIEGYQGGRVTYLGGSLEKFADSFLDIDAAVAYARTHSDRIVLAGHSHGCEKILNYIRQGGTAAGLLLLSPADSYRLQTEWLAGETIEQQVERLRSLPSSDGIELLDLSQFGIRAGRTEYPIPVTRETLIDWLECDGIRLFHPAGVKQWPVVELPTFCYLGGRDPLQGKFIDQMQELLRGWFKELTLHLEQNGDHQMRTVAPHVGSALAAWIVKQPG
jgi:pimeloyl-ACP methyl ester carboxylesterase